MTLHLTIPADHVFEAAKGVWKCVVNGRVYGDWPRKEYAQAGLSVERRRQNSLAYMAAKSGRPSLPNRET